MSKSKSVTKPSFDPPPIVGVPLAPPVPPVPAGVPLAPPVPPAPPSIGRVAVSLPLGDLPPEVFVPRHVEVRLDHRQATALRRLWYGYDGLGSRLLSGKRPQGNADVVRLLLEQVAEEAEESQRPKAENLEPLTLNLEP